MLEGMKTEIRKTIKRKEMTVDLTVVVGVE